MSTYIISDLHGASKRFYQMLDMIEIDWNKDCLIINGDIVDRGGDSLKLFYEIVDMQKQYGEHLVIIKGNHEHFIEMYVSGELPEKRYASYGGEDTIREIKMLDSEERLKLVEYISTLPIYMKYDSPIRGEMIIIHSGLHVDHIIMNEDGLVNVIKSIESALAWNENQLLISGYLQAEAPAWVTRGLDKVVCVGHVPTMYLPDVQAPIICVKKGGKVIMTDCGAGHRNGRLGCIRLDDEKLFYVE